MAIWKFSRIVIYIKIKENLNKRFKGINHIFTAKGAPVAAQPNPAAAAPANQNNQQ